MTADETNLESPVACPRCSWEGLAGECATTPVGLLRCPMIGCGWPVDEACDRPVIVDDELPVAELAETR